MLLFEDLPKCELPLSAMLLKMSAITLGKMLFPCTLSRN